MAGGTQKRTGPEKCLLSLWAPGLVVIAYDYKVPGLHHSCTQCLGHGPWAGGVDVQGLGCGPWARSVDVQDPPDTWTEAGKSRGCPPLPSSITPSPPDYPLLLLSGLSNPGSVFSGVFEPGVRRRAS